MSNHHNLVFFEKEGNYLNFSYNDTTDRFEGDILFHQNSSDTYKTYGIYTLEKIPSFEFELPGELTLNKFQLFNEWGFDFYGCKTATQSVSKIEPINNDPSFYSKWIYGIDFEKMFPVGTLISFNTQFLEWSDTKKVYAVVATKKGAAMIISSLDNATFETQYYSTYSDPTTYAGVSIRGINALGVYNYIDSTYQNNISKWSEPDFYDKYYAGKKLNIIGSEKNDGILTVKEPTLTDAVHFEYWATNMPSEENLIIEVKTRTDLPKIYEGGLTVNSDGTINFDGSFPKILKPGTEFKIIGSAENTNFLSVSEIPSFLGNTQQTFYATASLVIYENNIYECVQAYTQSFGDSLTKYVTPNKNTEYWKETNQIKVNETTTAETLIVCQLYLTTDKMYFEYGFTQSSDVTLAMAAEKYREDIKYFNIDLYYKKSRLRADLVYPSDYAEVNFYHGKVGLTYSFGNVMQTNERLVEVEESLSYELNYNYSENFKYNIVFTDIDEYGIKIVINKEVYEEEVNWVYTGATVDMERTIDRTLRRWLSRNYMLLYTLGITAELEYIGNYTSPFFNSIILRTQYPNVPMDINRVEVGTTAECHIEHSRVLFNDLGSYLTIDINDKPYEQQTIYGTFLDINGATVSATSSAAYTKSADIGATLTAWTDTHSETLADFGIIATNINNLLKFDIKNTDRRLDYTINTGKILLPGQTDFTITEKIKGSEGVLVSSNEVSLPAGNTFSFEDAGFATGMAFSINNTVYPLNNQEYSIQFLDPGVMNLSYQGPFWGLTDSLCNSSAYTTLAFSLGFGQTGCSTPAGITGTGGPFDETMFDDAMFSYSYNPTTYEKNTYSLSEMPGSGNLKDIKYIQLSNSVYLYGDGLIVMDSYLFSYLKTIELTGNTQSIEMEFNAYNNYIYCLSKNKLWVVDPLMNVVITSMALTNDAYDMEINPTNGDIYITYENSPTISVYNSSNALVSTITTPSALDTRTGKLAYNAFEKDMYVTTDADLLVRIDCTTRTVQTSYAIPGLKHSIYYEPVNESIYAYSDTNLWKIDNGSTYSITAVTSSSTSFDNMLFNNITGEMNISDSTNRFKTLNLNTNQVGVNADVSSYGYMSLNQYDGSVYMASKTISAIAVIDPTNGFLIHDETIDSKATRIIYNPDRKSVWAIQPIINKVVELLPTLTASPISGTSSSIGIEESLYGTLDPDYVPRESLWLKTREYMRWPRENFEGEQRVEFYWKWMTDDTPEFFIYDLSGEQLEKSGAYAYTGPKPLMDVPLNKYPNRVVEYASIPQYQQTVFDSVTHALDYIDDSNKTSSKPEPMQLFLGFKSETEGPMQATLQLYKKEDVEFTITSTATNNTILYFETLDEEGPDKRGQIRLNTDSGEVFTDKGLKVGQLVAVYLKDTTNIKNQYISHNNGSIFKIRGIYTWTIILDFIDPTVDFVEKEQTVLEEYPTAGKTTYLKATFNVIDREIGRFAAYAQTEIEDIRFKIELSNVGKIIGANEAFIFKEYDILEGGIDWNLVNKKRKEMLMMKSLIYPYIGSYKSIINAINFFGYNDLQLNEYYRNIDSGSKDFHKLFKVEIPDIFDNTVEGWNESDFLKHTFPNEKFEETNLLNLTYQITDKDGTNLLEYSLDDITIKLQGLKFWLKKNIIPLTHKILDITGKSYFRGGTQVQHISREVKIINTKSNMTPVSFKLNEAYLMPVNSGSTVYNCVLDFYTIIDGVGADKNPTGLVDPPKPYNGAELKLPDYFTIRVRTYKTYKEWMPFTTYSKGDKVIYYEKIYESVIDNNKVNSPRKYEDASTWSATDTYIKTNIVEYNSEIFVYSGLGQTYSGVPPVIDQGSEKNWLNITEWKQIRYEPVQIINEYRRIEPLGSSHSNGLNPILPYNFTIDSNIDPFITVEVTSDNGYGSIYRDRKNYEIRGIKDITSPIKSIDQIGPFQPIKII